MHVRSERPANRLEVLLHEHPARVFGTRRRIEPALEHGRRAAVLVPRPDPEGRCAWVAGRDRGNEAERDAESRTRSKLVRVGFHALGLEPAHVEHGLRCEGSGGVHVHEPVRRRRAAKGLHQMRSARVRRLGGEDRWPVGQLVRTHEGDIRALAVTGKRQSTRGRQEDVRPHARCLQLVLRDRWVERERVRGRWQQRHGVEAGQRHADDAVHPLDRRRATLRTCQIVRQVPHVEPGWVAGTCAQEEDPSRSHAAHRSP